MQVNYQGIPAMLRIGAATEKGRKVNIYRCVCGNSLTYRSGSKVQSLTMWCTELGLSYSKVRQRITKLGWSPSKALGVPDLVQEQVKT